MLRQAHALLNGWPPPYSTHPPAAKVLLALSVYLFGNSPWGWRAMNALIGTALVPITYLLARRLFRSRSAAVIAAGLVLCEGFYLVASRVAMINIVYVTAAAGAYLIVWRFVQEPDDKGRRLDLIAIGTFLGIFVASKAAISEVGVLLCVAVMVTAIVSNRSTGAERSAYRTLGKVVFACGLVGLVISIIYLLFFLPYFRTEWSSIGDLIAYHRRVFRRNLTFPEAFANSSPAWSWPMLLTPYAYWKRDLIDGTTRVIWCGGNPLLWWAILPAVPIACIRAYVHRSLAWLFVVAGYFAFLAMWLPIHRYLFIYSYLPALYFGLLALTGSLDECWSGSAPIWQQLILLVPVLVCLAFLVGSLRGGLLGAGVLAVYLFLIMHGSRYQGRYVFLAFGLETVWLGVYFLPLWMGAPISQSGYLARMWLQGPGLASWL